MAKWIVFVVDDKDQYDSKHDPEVDIQFAIEELGLQVEYVMKAPTEDTEVIVNRILK